MKLEVEIIFNTMTYKAKKNLCKVYGVDFYRDFKRRSKKSFKDMLQDVPCIGKSVFSLCYNYGPCYFAWYKALREQNICKEEALKLIWQINEDYVKSFQKPILHWFGKNIYLGGFRRKAAESEKRGKEGTLHPFDWRIEYKDIDKNTFAINVYECGMLKLAKKFGFMEMFPQVCRMDYLFSHYFGNSFKRTGTLADGNNCCDCWYQCPGECEWKLEQGPGNRK